MLFVAQIYVYLFFLNETYANFAWGDEEILIWIWDTDHDSPLTLRKTNITIDNVLLILLQPTKWSNQAALDEYVRNFEEILRYSKSPIKPG